MLKVEGNYAFSFSIANKKDFLTDQTLIDFTLETFSGFNLPTYSLEFLTVNQDIISHLNEGNTITVSLGKSETNTKNIVLRPVGDPKIVNISADTYKVTSYGFLNVPNYLNNYSRIYPNMSAAEVINFRAKELGLLLNKNNLKESKDKQNWINFGESDRRFFAKTLMKMDLKDSFPVSAITSAGELRLFDFVEYFKKEKKYYIFSQQNKKNAIQYTDLETISEDSELINYWIGYLSKSNDYDLITGLYKKYTTDAKNILASTNKLVRSALEEIRLDKMQISNENIHKNYHRSHQNNLRNSAIFSRSRIGLSVENSFMNIEPLDLAYVELYSNTDTEILDSLMSGNYVVSKVCSNLSQRKVKTFVELCRESMNKNIGNIK